MTSSRNALCLGVPLNAAASRRRAASSAVNKRASTPRGRAGHGIAYRAESPITT